MCLDSLLHHTFTIISDCIFQFNIADAGGIMEIIGSTVIIKNCKFNRNIGSLYAFNSNITLGDQNIFEECIEPHSTKTFYGTFTTKEGGAITSYQSNIYLTGVVSLIDNKADQGGAVLAVESTIAVYGRMTVVNNMATNDSGGGLYLHRSRVNINGICVISNNYAKRGGGVHAISSIIDVYQPGSLRIINNTADAGGGMCLEVSPRVNILLSGSGNANMSALFINNHANYGRGIFVVDNTSSAACSSSVECFFQSLTLDQSSTVSLKSIAFFDNSATVDGSDLFGGLLDRCIPSPFAETKVMAFPPYNGITYLGNISSIQCNTITSLPVRICFCRNANRFDCGYELNPIKVEKGETFSISVVAVDQASHPVDANIVSTFTTSSTGAFGEGQQTQKVNKSCTDLTFNVFSQDDNETIKLLLC